MSLYIQRIGCEKQNPAFGSRKTREAVNILVKEGMEKNKARALVKEMMEDKQGIARIKNGCPNTHEGIAGWVLRIVKSTAGIIVKANS